MTTLLETTLRNCQSFRQKSTLTLPAKLFEPRSKTVAWLSFYLCGRNRNQGNSIRNWFNSFSEIMDYLCGKKKEV